MISLTTSTSTVEFLKLSPSHKNCVYQSKCKNALANTGFQLQKTLVERTLEKCLRKLTVMNVVSLETQRILNFPEDG